MERFVISKNYISTAKRFNLKSRKIEFKIKNIPDNIEPTSWIKGAVEDVFEYLKKEFNPTDLVGITFCGESFKERGPGWLNFKELSKLTADDIWLLISKIFQSNSKGLSTDTFCLGITSVNLPVGSSRPKKFNSFDEESVKRRGIIVIKNRDNLCLPRALVVAMAYIRKKADAVKIRKNTGKLQHDLTTELLEKSNIIIPAEGCGIPQLQQFQNYLQDYKIVVYKYDSKGRDVIFSGSNDGPRINLLHHTNHYNVITSLTAAFSCVYYCEACHAPYNNKKNQHRCGRTCPLCQQYPPCQKAKREILCETCYRKFRNEQCYNNHLNPFDGRSLCDSVRRCKDCLKIITTNREHVCGEIYCKICSSHVPNDHQCFILENKGQPYIEGRLFIFYDLETRQEKTSGPYMVHEPNLCVFQQRCQDCMEKSDLLCMTCGITKQVLHVNALERFVEYILNQRTIFKEIVVLAHNGQAFDHQFILNHILQKTKLKPELIMRGTKIILMKIGNVRFIDSLNYFPMALAKLPKAFDLGSDMKKGYFPYLFNTTANENYVGCLPDLKYYIADAMKIEDRAVFMNWYNEHKNDMFDMKKELVDYCVSDVNILTNACLKFRKMMIQECNVCPFTEGTTIASACNLVYRRNFLKPNTIGIIPKNGYRNTDNQSKSAIKWLIWEESQRNINIVHSAKQEEVRIKGVKVDGFCEETKQIFEFHGCYYHGHPDCLKHNRDGALHDDPSDTMNRHYEGTHNKTERLRTFGYEVIEMWECDFSRQMNTNKEMEFLNTHEFLKNTPLNPRDAFYGGRTGNTCLYYKCKPGEKIKYIDVCSLYPWVCKYGKYPVGHPEIYIGNENCRKLDIENINGLIKCKILPPTNLYHPVLPLKQNNKLMFSLCQTCSKEKCTSDCSHKDNERALNGTWVIEEVVKAVQKGYKIMEIQEIWSYRVDQYDKMNRTGGLFTAMMDKFLKIKQQATGWPSSCFSQELKERYIEDFFKNEGIKLEFQEVLCNSGLRSLAKLMLNSFWGKFGQRENQPKTSIINDTAEFFALMTDSSKEVCHILPINDETLIVNWEYKEEATDILPTVNVCIAAYTTTQARLKLYSYLEALGNRVLYYDTDSVIFISKEGEYEPPVGEFVGDMTDELECYGPGSYITEFVSGGPKNYAYNVFSGKDNSTKTICKVKGINLNYDASKKVNFQTIKEMILNENVSHIEISSHNIRRLEDHRVVTVTEVKKYQPKAEKRIFGSDFGSAPYGFKKSKK